MTGPKAPLVAHLVGVVVAVVAVVDAAAVADCCCGCVVAGSVVYVVRVHDEAFGSPSPLCPLEVEQQPTTQKQVNIIKDIV